MNVETALYWYKVMRSFNQHSLSENSFITLVYRDNEIISK